MEEKKTYPSLPSNYVTLAQLQERWLKKHNQLNQPQSLPQPQPQHEQNKQKQLPLPNHHHLQPPRNGTAPPKQSHPKNRNDSQAGRRATEAASDDRRKSEAGDAIGDESADLDGTVSESKKMWKKKKKTKPKPKPKAKESGASEGAAAQGNEDAGKTTIESKLNDKKNDSSITVEEVEQKIRIVSMNSGNGKQSGRLRKMNNGFRHSQSQRNYANDQRARVQKSDKMVWVRKDGNVGEIET